MPTRTGTASQVNASVNNSSTSVTVPGDATVAVAFFGHYNGDGTTLSTLTLNGVGFTIQSQIAPVPDHGVGVATLLSPATGSQTLAWDWGDTNDRSEGGEIVVVYVKDHNTSTPVRDFGTDNGASTANVEVALDTETTDLLLAFAFSVGEFPALAGTVFIDNLDVSGHFSDTSEVTPSATTTTVTMTGEEYSGMAAISLPSAAGATQTLAPSTDSVDGNWTDDGGGTSLAAAIDEETPSNTDYIRSELSPQSSGCRVKLESGGDPAVSTGHEINWRIAKDTAAGQTINMTVKLYQGGGNSLGGGTLIADFDRNDVPSSFTDYTETLSGGEADAITDYTDLYLELHADVP